MDVVHSEPVEIQARKWFNESNGLGIEIELNFYLCQISVIDIAITTKKQPDWKRGGFLFPTQQTESQTKMSACRLLIKVNDAV